MVGTLGPVLKTLHLDEGQISSSLDSTFGHFYARRLERRSKNLNHHEWLKTFYCTCRSGSGLPDLNIWAIEFRIRILTSKSKNISGVHEANSWPPTIQRNFNLELSLLKFLSVSGLTYQVLVIYTDIGPDFMLSTTIEYTYTNCQKTCAQLFIMHRSNLLTSVFNNLRFKRNKQHA